MQTSDDLAQEASKRRAKLDADQAELDRLETAARQAAEREQAARDAATYAWWDERRSGFGDRVRGRIDAAWDAFRAAVRDGGDTVATWRAFRVAVTEVTDDRLSIDLYFHEYERRRVQDIQRHHHRVSGEARVLCQVQVPRDLSRAEYDARLAAWRDDASAYVGRTLTDDEVNRQLGRRSLVDLLPFPPRDPIPPRSDGDGRITSYAEAIDRVIADLEAETLATARAARDSDREQSVEAKVKAAR